MGKKGQAIMNSAVYDFVWVQENEDDHILLDGNNLHTGGGEQLIDPDVIRGMRDEVGGDY